MKTTKKILALVLVAVMIMALGTTAFAASIEVKNVVNGEKYTAYKILNYTTNGKGAYSYYLTSDEYAEIGAALEDAGFEFEKSSDGTRYTVTNADSFDPAAAAAALANSNLGDALGKAEATGANGQANFDGLNPGYYFVTSSLGTLCALHSETDIATAVEKNTVTTHDKKQGTAEGTYADAQLDLNIGDTVYYDVDITIGKGADQDIKLTDKLSDGLDLQDQIKVTLGGEAVAAANYTLVPNDHGFVLTLKAAYVKTLKENDVVKVEYSAVINDKAVIRDANTNTATLEYSNQTTKDTTVVKTYDVVLKKTDGKDALAGAKFNVYTQETGGTALTFSKDATGYYLDAAGAAEIDAGDGTGVNIRGLAPGEYWFEETVAPDGYNKLASRVKVVVTKDATAPAEISVPNVPGSPLPTTGGIGTTIFYILGSILVIGAGIVLVSKRRMTE